MTSLRDAAMATDAALDWALLRVGILAPADLDQIRSLLTRPGVDLRAAVNGDGHRIIEIVNGAQIAQVHHDGHVLVCVASNY